MGDWTKTVDPITMRKKTLLELEAEFEILDAERRTGHWSFADRSKLRLRRSPPSERSPMEPLRLEVRRGMMYTGTQGDRVSEISEWLVALEVVRMTKWGPMTSKRLDKSKSDWLFMLDGAKLFVQVKGSTFGTSRNLTWTLKAFMVGKGLKRELFAEPDFYLAMVLFPCTSEVFHSNVLLPAIGWRILMVPGSGVIKYFEGDESHKPKSKNTHNITISPDSLEKGEHEWWMGENPEDIEGIFRARYEQQKGER